MPAGWRIPSGNSSFNWQFIFVSVYDDSEHLLVMRSWEQVMHSFVLLLQVWEWSVVWPAAARQGAAAAVDGHTGPGREESQTVAQHFSHHQVLGHWFVTVWIRDVKCILFLFKNYIKDCMNSGTNNFSFYFYQVLLQSSILFLLISKSNGENTEVPVYDLGFYFFFNTWTLVFSIVKWFLIFNVR